MPIEEYEDTDLYTIEYDTDLDAIVYTWNKFATGETFREGANALLEFIKRRDTSRLIVDTSGIQAHDDDDQAWLEEEWIPKIIDAGIERAATVHKDSVISRMDMEEFVQDVDGLPYSSMITDSMDEAREWIAEE